MRRIGLAVVLTISLLFAPATAWLQPKAKTPRIAFIFNSIPESEIVGSEPKDTYASGFLKGMRDLGWIDGQNITIERRSAEGKPERFSALAREVLASYVDVVVVSGTPRASEVWQLSRTTPIVMAGGGAESVIQVGLAKSVARPGGTVTGLTTVAGAEFEDKRLQLLKEMVPSILRVAHLGNPVAIKPHTEIAARALSLTLVPVELTDPSGFDRAFAAVRRERVDGVSLTDVNFLWAHRQRIIEFAAKERLPVVYWDRVFAESGGLMSYGSDYSDIIRRTALYVDKILRGTKPGDLPLEQPTKFELVINVKTARALGLKIPQSLLLRADQLIE